MAKRNCNVEKCNRLGTALGMCNLHYQRHIHGRPLTQDDKPVYEICTIPDCEKPSRTKHADKCAMHYHREYRHGAAHMTAYQTDVTASLGRRYRVAYRPQHPLAFRDGRVYVHRMVLFDAIGYGPHSCYWCHRTIDWAPKGTPGELQPDHINGLGDDNRLDNLVPSCRSCNTLRGAQSKSDALRDAGWWSNNDTIAKLTGQQRKPRII